MMKLSERKAAYYLALELVEKIDRFVCGSHLRTIEGKSVFTLDQAVCAILEDKLAPVGGMR